MAVVVLTVVLASSLPGLDADQRQVADTDGYMRLVRVQELLEGETSWFDSAAPRSNAPFGHEMHWTRPFDLLVIAGALPLLLFLPLPDAIYWSGISTGPLLLVALALIIAWAAEGLLGRRLAFLAGLGVVLQPALLAYGGVGRVDHHGLILLVAAALLGYGVRLLQTAAPERAAVVGGVLAALALWVSVELLLVVAVVSSAAAWVWISRGGDLPVKMVRFSFAWLAGTLLALLLERGVGLLDLALDRISLVHLTLSGLAAGVWVVAARVSREARRMTRGVIMASSIGLAALVLLVLFPAFLAGPFGDVPPQLWEAWLGQVAELQPLWPLGEGPVRMLYLLGAPLLALPLAIRAYTSELPPRRPAWLLLVVWLVATIVLGLTQLRFTALAQVGAVIPIAWLAGQMLQRIGEGRTISSALARVAGMAFSLSGFLLPTVLAGALLPPAPATEPQPAPCSATQVAAAISASVEAGEVVLAHVDLGPELLFRTKASVIATPYHRNVEGILDARTFMLAAPEEAAEVAGGRQVDLVVLCEGRDRGYLGSVADEPGTLFAALTEGKPPPWLAVLAKGESFVVYQVRHPALPIG